MSKCEICGGRAFRQEEVEEVFHIDGRYVLVEHIPATVCVQCGEKTFDAATAEDIRKMLSEGRHASRKVEMDVFAY
jgi:HTH-type transcriptional regulator / antitoxin MqsA